MVTLLLTIFIVLSLIVAAVLIARRLGIGFNPQPTRKLTESETRQKKSEITRWRSVKIKPGLICCKSAYKLSGEIFFATDAPDFPLAGCTEKSCQCKYVHLEDRRDGDERREATDYSIELFALHEKERRNGTDRRTITI